MKVICWYHTTYSGLQAEQRPNATVEHDYNPEEAGRLLEQFSHGDWENGPRCLDEILADDDGRDLEPLRWVQ